MADTSIWIDHFRSPNRDLITLLDAGKIGIHQGIIGELACGNLVDRAGKLRLLKRLEIAPLTSHDDVLSFIDMHQLMGRGIGYIDMQLLASTALQKGHIWTRDRRLKQAAEQLGLSY